MYDEVEPKLSKFSPRNCGEVEHFSSCIKTELASKFTTVLFHMMVTMAQGGCEKLLQENGRKEKAVLEVSTCSTAGISLCLNISENMKYFAKLTKNWHFSLGLLTPNERNKKPPL